MGDRLAVGYTAAVLLLALGHVAAHDPLLRNSPPASVAILAASAGLVAVPVVLLARLLRRAVRRDGAVAVAGGRGIGADAVLVLLVATILVIGADETLAWTRSVPGFLAALALSTAVAVLLVRRLPDRAAIRARTVGVARVIAVAGVALALVAPLVLRGRSAAAGSDEARHLVFVVIDGLPGDLLPPATVARWSDEGLHLSGARTNRVYTEGYFKALYHGSLDPRPDDGSLLDALGDAGVTPQLVVSHQNALPDTLGITDYPGVRSAFLDERLAWWPRLLGLDYHVFLNRTDTRRFMGDRTDLAYRLLRGGEGDDGLWRGFLPGEVARLHRRHDRTATFIHAFFGEHTVQALEGGGPEDDAVAELYAHASDHEYRYGPEHGRAAATVARTYRARARLWAERLDRFLAELRAGGTLDDTLVVVTADHGSIVDRGLLWYGYHAEEEVTGVPLFVFGAGRTGEVTAPVDTLDLVATIRDHFDLEAGTGPGRSLLRALPERPVPVLTLPSASRREWFLALYRDGERHVVNLHPDGDGRVRHARLAGGEVTGETTVVPDAALRHDIREAVARLGIEGQVRESFDP